MTPSDFLHYYNKTFSFLHTQKVLSLFIHRVFLLLCIFILKFYMTSVFSSWRISYDSFFRKVMVTKKFRFYLHGNYFIFFTFWRIFSWISPSYILIIFQCLMACFHQFLRSQFWCFYYYYSLECNISFSPLIFKKISHFYLDFYLYYYIYCYTGGFLAFTLFGVLRASWIKSLVRINCLK